MMIQSRGTGIKGTLRMKPSWLGLGDGELLSAVGDRRQSFTLGETESGGWDGWTTAKCRDSKKVEQ